jgi:hypothetical protein
MILAATINQKTHKKNDKMSVIILTDSKNLVLGGNDGFPMEAILDKVPFESFKDNNIRDITIELISCNTIEICQKTTEQIAALAKTHQMKISVRFCDKFIFNNISYIHLREATNQHIFDLLLKQKKASKDQEPAMSWNDIVNEASFRKKFQSTVTHFFQNSSEKQETVLIPVEDLGFVTTTLGAGDLSGIKEKKFPLSNTATMIHLTPQPDAAGADAATAYEETQKAATAASFKIVKKMLEPKVTFRGGGDFYLWSADYREPELIVAKKAALSRPLSPTSAHKMQEVTGLLTNTA